MYGSKEDDPHCKFLQLYPSCIPEKVSKIHRVRRCGDIFPSCRGKPFGGLDSTKDTSSVRIYLHLNNNLGIIIQNFRKQTCRSNCKRESRWHRDPFNLEEVRTFHCGVVISQALILLFTFQVLLLTIYYLSIYLSII